jgi:hypothetical protein
MIRNYNDFVETLLVAGFSMGGGNDEGIYAVIPWGWKESPPYDTPVSWHTGDSDTDPWEWRIKVLDERDDIAYAKLFFKKSGYITKGWYPYFLAARREGKVFDDACADGKISDFAKRIYEVVMTRGSLSVEDIKSIGGFSKEDKSGFDRALTELQMKMYLTMCGKKRKLSRKGEEFGWSSTVFCTVESYFDKDIFEKAVAIGADEARRVIREQILKLNPQAQEKKISKFIL